MTGRNARVLIVDDSPMQREILKRMVQSEGHTVRTAGSAVEGISVALSWRPDVVVSDVVMPEIGGYHLCRFLKNDGILCNTPVILLTGAAVRRQDRFWGLKSGADAYITKSSDPGQLLGLIGQLVASRAQTAGEAQGNDAPTEDAEIATSIHALFDRLLFETTVSNEIRSLSAIVHRRDDLLERFSDLVDSLLDVALLAVAVFAPERPLLFVAPKEAVGASTTRSLRRAIGRACECPELLQPTADVELLVCPEERFVPTCVSLGGPGATTVPLRVGASLVGALHIQPAPDARVAANDVHVLARELAPVIATLRYYGEVQRLSNSDDMTGLANTRWIMQALRREWDRYRRYKGVFSWVVLDLDEFKQINDTWGHQAGDAVLRAVAEVLKQVRRDVDVVARYGGDEFFILMPETSLAGALRVVERLVARLRALLVDVDGARVRVTGSFGVTQVSESCRGVEDLVAAADRALYEAKEAGRNGYRAHVLGQGEGLDVRHLDAASRMIDAGEGVH